MPLLPTSVKPASLALALFAASCTPFSRRVVHDLPYVEAELPAAPDYGDPANWAALPDRADEADALPKGAALLDRQAGSPADVFFLYPTLYTDAPDGRFPWNASVTDAKLNARIDESSIRLQASAFNGAGRVFAPRYRQAHIAAYYTDDSTKTSAAFDTAYVDLRRAFRYYLDNFNDGRPIILAGHSQGTTHGKRLAREFFDGIPLGQQLVAAYLVGIAVAPDYFSDELPPCETPDQTGCFVSWRTWQRPALPEETVPAVVVNPLLWTTDTTYAPRELNRGGTLRKLALKPDLSDAQVHGSVLWINRPHFFGKRLIRMDNWHPADYNLFYANVRANAWARVQAFVAAAGDR